MNEPAPSGPSGGKTALFHSISTHTAFGPGPEGQDLLVEILADVALDAARSAAAILAEGARIPASGVSTKSSATDLVTDTDRASEKAVSQILATRRPEDGILGEEGTSRDGSSGVRWVVDPLDGTTNFFFGIPQFSVSIAAEIEGQGVVGVVIDPMRDETWATAVGHGAWLNGTPCIGARGRSSLETALVGTGFGYRSEDRRRQARVAAQVIPAVRDVRRMGSAALDLCWTAGGRYDAYYEWGLSPWDRTAGRLMVAESGLREEVLDGDLVVAAPPELFDDLVALLTSAGAFADLDTAQG